MNKSNSNEQTIVSYETLHSGAIVSIQLPKNVTLRQKLDLDGNVEVEYLHWGVNLPGGVVNVHVYSTDRALANTTIRARVEVVVKTTETGRKYILVNYHPVDKAERPTHRLVIVDDTCKQKKDWLVFRAPNMRGIVALIGPDEKIVQPDSKPTQSASSAISVLPARIVRVALPKVKAPEAPKAKPEGKTHIVGSFADLGQLLSAE